MPVEYLSPTELTATIAAGATDSDVQDLGGFCRYVRIVADGTPGGSGGYFVKASLDGANFYTVYQNGTLQQSNAAALEAVFEIGYARYVKICRS